MITLAWCSAVRPRRSMVDHTDDKKPRPRAAAGTHLARYAVLAVLPQPSLAAEDDDLADRLIDWHVAAAWSSWRW
jgi:hypothetical protein